MKKNNRIIIVGAGDAGEIILSEYYRAHRNEEIIGFIDDDKTKRNKTISHKKVLGTRKSLTKLIKKYKVNKIIIALPSVQNEIIKETVSSLVTTNPQISIQILPEITRYFENNLVQELEDVSLNDLIDREEYELDIPLIEKTYHDKVVLITGAGGSIGSEICYQLQRFKIKKLICVGRGENSIFELAKKLKQYSNSNGIEYIYKICNIKDFALLEKIYKEYKPDIVFHAAAHKHVPLMEFNEIEAIQNNIIGSDNILKLSSKYNVKRFVLVSTDKAVNPKNIMGATKRVTEILAAYYHNKYNLNTSAVRFGNVLGSRGSVIPIFREQIENGGPVTITHPEIKRYFMSIPEASLLVINAAAYAMGGETFMLKMGKQYKIVDIAKKLIQLYGLEPDKDIKIEFKGLRPGEKLSEDLYYDEKDLIDTANEKIYVIKDHAHEINEEDIELFLNYDLKSIINSSSITIREIIKRIVPEYDYSNLKKYSNKSNRLVN